MSITVTYMYVTSCFFLLLLMYF